MRWLFATYIAVAVVFAVIVGVSIAIYLRFSDKLNSTQARRWRCFFNLLLRTSPLSSYAFYIFFIFLALRGKWKISCICQSATCWLFAFIYVSFFILFSFDFFLILFLTLCHMLPQHSLLLLILLLRAAVFFYSLTMMPQSITTRRCHMLTHTKI